MRTFIYSPPQSTQGNEIKIGLLGTCRVTDAFERMHDQKLIKRGAITIGSYVQTPAQSLQRLAWCCSQIELPEDFRQYIFDNDVVPRTEFFLKEVADLDVLLIEVGHIPQS